LKHVLDFTPVHQTRQDGPEGYVIPKQLTLCPEICCYC